LFSIVCLQKEAVASFSPAEEGFAVAASVEEVAVAVAVGSSAFD
jgi:hypothetical protein